MKNLLFVFTALTLTFASCGKAEVNEAVLTGEENAALSVDESIPENLVLVIESVKYSETHDAISKNIVTHALDIRYPREIVFPYDLKLEFVFEMWDDWRPVSLGKYYTRIETLEVPAGSYAPSLPSPILHKGFMGVDRVLMMTGTLKEVRVTKKNSKDRINYTISVLPIDF